jgi:glycosyltransferase involved in cell wall biosynthesis
MRILFFLQCLGVGGVERQIFLLADHLGRRGHRVSIAALHTFDQNWKWFWNPDSVQVQLFFSKTPRGALSAASQLIKATLKLRSLLKGEDIQLMYSTQWAISNFIAWLATRGMPDTALIWSVRGSGSKTTRYRIDWKMALLSHLCKWVSPSVPLSISNSEAGYVSRKARGYRCQKNVVIFNGADVDQFRPDSEARVRVRSEWAIPENEKLIGLVGRLDPVKDHSTFFTAAALLADERKDVRFVCIGDGPQTYRIQLQRLSQELGLTERLIWAGAREDMPAVYNAMDIVCSSSLREGFPNVIAEAMACGVPCVVTDVGDSAKIVGDMGIVVPLDNPHMLAGGLRTMLQKLHETNPDLLRERIVRYFSVETMVEATERILIETCSGRVEAISASRYGEMK